MRGRGVPNLRREFDAAPLVRLSELSRCRVGTAHHSAIGCGGQCPPYGKSDSGMQSVEQRRLDASSERKPIGNGRTGPSILRFFNRLSGFVAKRCRRVSRTLKASGTLPATVFVSKNQLDAQARAGHSMTVKPRLASRAGFEMCSSALSALILWVAVAEVVRLQKCQNSHEFGYPHFKP